MAEPKVSMANMFAALDKSKKKIKSEKKAKVWASYEMTSVGLLFALYPRFFFRDFQRK